MLATYTLIQHTHVFAATLAAFVLLYVWALWPRGRR